MTGLKLALTIGINDYPGTGSDLSGCVADALAWTGCLTGRGFTVETLLDSQATLQSTHARIQALIAAVGWGDIAVITYSGHGSWVPDYSGDEPDGRDEGLCMYDVAERGLLTDDALHDLFSARKHGARIIFISDSCHSGTVNRFAPAVWSERPKVRFLPPELHLPREQQVAARAVAGVPPRGMSRPSALLMSGCRDNEYSYDGYGPNRMGAFTFCALATLERLPQGATYADWNAEIRALLPAQDIPQTPQLTGTRAQRSWPIFEPVVG